MCRAVVDATVLESGLKLRLIELSHNFLGAEEILKTSTVSDILRDLLFVRYVGDIHDSTYDIFFPSKYNCQ